MKKETQQITVNGSTHTINTLREEGDLWLVANEVLLAMGYKMAEGTKQVNGLGNKASPLSSISPSKVVGQTVLWNKQAMENFKKYLQTVNRLKKKLGFFYEVELGIVYDTELENIPQEKDPEVETKTAQRYTQESFDEGDLPEIGDLCEYRTVSVTSAATKWEECIVCYTGDITVIEEVSMGIEKSANSDFVEFRPILTKEQVLLGRTLPYVKDLTDPVSVILKLQEEGFLFPELSHLE